MMRRAGRRATRTPGRVLRLGAALLLVAAGLGGLAQNEGGGNEAVVYRVDIDSTINPGALGLLEHAIDTAEAAGARALIVRLDTPGGLLSTTRDMVGAISESNVPVIGYVGPSGANAGSAGAFILLASHVAAMNAGTNVGASTPVSGEGRDIEGALGKKVMNDSKAFMRSIAGRHGRNAETAERFVSEALSLTAKEALEKNVIDLRVEAPAGLLAAVHGRTVTIHGKAVTLDVGDAGVRDVEPRLIDRVLTLIAHPQIAHLLLSLGLLAIYIEIVSPGLAFPGVLGTIAVILGLISMQTLPVNTGFLLLLVLGAVLMTAEYFAAGFGALGIGGAVAFVFGSLYLFDAPTTEDYRGGILSVSIAVCAAMLLTAFLVTRSIFAGPKPRKVEGRTGEAMINFDRSGYVLVDGERWPADTTETLHHGDRIVVTGKNEEGRLSVKKAPETG